MAQPERHVKDGQCINRSRTQGNRDGSTGARQADRYGETNQFQDAVGSFSVKTKMEVNGVRLVPDRWIGFICPFSHNFRRKSDTCERSMLGTQSQGHRGVSGSEQANTDRPDVRAHNSADSLFRSRRSTRGGGNRNRSCTVHREPQVSENASVKPKCQPRWSHLCQNIPLLFCSYWR